MNKLIVKGSEPAVIQQVINGYQLTWNPDDGRFYIEAPNKPATVFGSFKLYRNAVQFAKKRKFLEG